MCTYQFNFQLQNTFVMKEYISELSDQSKRPDCLSLPPV